MKVLTYDGRLAYVVALTKKNNEICYKLNNGTYLKRKSVVEIKRIGPGAEQEMRRRGKVV